MWSAQLSDNYSIVVVSIATLEEEVVDANVKLNKAMHERAIFQNIVMHMQL